MLSNWSHKPIDNIVSDHIKMASAVVNLNLCTCLNNFQSFYFIFNVVALFHSL